ncbi:MAG: SNF2-related protein [Candidatus Auribacterota bacterium]|jgi:ERCC4-related helicase|nr:SNF2-related protein [Candidatus Auribacterota bacterium]
MNNGKLFSDYHAKYFSHELMRSSTEDGIEKISRSLFDACVDLNPHQIEAALFALKSPLSKGIILADEVGLGKTIEAGLVLCQFWAERKRNLLVVCPASLRKQWSLELEEKFNIPSLILETKTFNDFIDSGIDNPFQQDKVVICSYQFINSKKDLVKLVNWNLSVIDEAHKLRNAYRKSNVLGQAIKWALDERKKLLLTATPLQNSLMELFGLSTIIDDYLFGDSQSFRQMYVNESDLVNLQRRLNGFCKRTLREQVLEYVPYTNRTPITITFSQNEEEIKLYNDVTAFLQRPDSYAVPTGQRSLLTLVIRKILASSSYALIETLETMKRRLENMLKNLPEEENFIDHFTDDESLDDEEIEEIEDFLNSEDQPDENQNIDNGEIDRKQVQEEIDLLNNFIIQAKNVAIDSKTTHLKEAIERGFAMAKRMDAQQKVVVFTESKRTQLYLKNYLDSNGYKGRIITINGSNNDADSQIIYDEWLQKNRNSGRVTGSRSSDKRNAILERFRDDAEILIATESAAEGINLQFCSLVINYDLPWNPQRIEQRIGRCHRYGQKCDVVVINFLNERNEVDRKVFQILEEKFRLFDGVFGASDEVLGALESGVDFEKEVLKIYQQCRRPEEIERAFAELQKKLEDKIQSRIQETKEILIEHFDEDVHERLRAHLHQTQDFLNKMEKRFWGITENVLFQKAKFDHNEYSFHISSPPVDAVLPGKYFLISKNKTNIDGGFLYRMSHPLGEYVLDTAKHHNTPPAKIKFDISRHPTKISVVDKLKGKSGYLVLSKLTIDSFDKDEYLLFNAFDDNGTNIHPEICEKMFECYADIEHHDIPPDVHEKLMQDALCHSNGTIDKVMERNNFYYQQECDRLFKWADDLIISAEKELKNTKNKLRNLNRLLRQATSIQEKLGIQEQIKETQRVQRRQRQRIFDVEDEIEQKRDVIIDKLKHKMKQKTNHETLFMVRWSVV